MNERTTTTGSGPNVGLLLLIPAVALVARAAARHHRMRWDEADGPAAPFGRHGHHYAGPDGGADARAGLRLPPRIEAMLDAWHARAHEATVAPEPGAAADA